MTVSSGRRRTFAGEGALLPRSVMSAGRWKDIRMLARYVEQEGLDESVVADARARRLHELVEATTVDTAASVEIMFDDDDDDDA